MIEPGEVLAKMLQAGLAHELIAQQPRNPVALQRLAIAATLMFHNFWAAPEAQVVVPTTNFLKNLGLLGALALIACYGPGPYAVQAAMKAGPKGAAGLS